MYIYNFYYLSMTISLYNCRKRQLKIQWQSHFILERSLIKSSTCVSRSLCWAIYSHSTSAITSSRVWTSFVASNFFKASIAALSPTSGPQAAAPLHQAQALRRPCSIGKAQAKSRYANRQKHQILWAYDHLRQGRQNNDRLCHLTKVRPMNHYVLAIWCQHANCKIPSFTRREQWSAPRDKPTDDCVKS